VCRDDGQGKDGWLSNTGACKEGDTGCNDAEVGSDNVVGNHSQKQLKREGLYIHALYISTDTLE
jgi:hypothetical protein